jgi:hypothetical protein
MANSGYCGGQCVWGKLAILDFVARPVNGLRAGSGFWAFWDSGFEIETGGWRPRIPFLKDLRCESFA